jgi:hypothetical protein
MTEQVQKLLIAAGTLIILIVAITVGIVKMVDIFATAAGSCT